MPQLPEIDLETFRPYLAVLARLHLPPELRRKLDPSDIVQETLLEAHRDRAAFAGHNARQQAAWLRRILANNLANQVRDFRRQKRNVKRERSLENILDDSALRLEQWLVAEQPSPSSHAARDEEALRLAGALAALPADEQEVLLMRHCEEMPLEAIADRVGVSRRTVARLLRRGLATLRDTLDRLDDRTAP